MKPVCHIFEMNGESCRFRQSVKRKKNKDWIALP
jgi:hypothetical protein